MDIEIIKILTEGGPWGTALLFLFLFLQERKYSRDITTKSLDLALEVNAMKDQLREIKDTSGRIDKLLLIAEDIKALVRRHDN